MQITENGQYREYIVPITGRVLPIAGVLGTAHSQYLPVTIAKDQGGIKIWLPPMGARGPPISHECHFYFIGISFEECRMGTP